VNGQFAAQEKRAACGRVGLSIVHSRPEQSG
jgi:hypothetical protein